MRLATTLERCVTHFTHASGARLIKRLLPISAALGMFFVCQLEMGKNALISFPLVVYSQNLELL